MNSYELLKQIYTRMQDDISKKIYTHRLLYALSGDQKQIETLVVDEMKRYGRHDLMNRCMSWARERQKIGGG